MKYYCSRNFSVKIDQQKDKVFLLQQITNPAIHTDILSGTIPVLLKKIPTIFGNFCCNNAQLSFKNEVKNTEVGHLFEHLILENLKLETLKKENNADYIGETTWNWNLEKIGTYNITIFSPTKNKDIFYKACMKSIAILEEIYNYNSIPLAGAEINPRPAETATCTRLETQVLPYFYLRLLS
ncbi:hypothetical protein A3A76_05505 [Candidatus Woesebacteria bacterium RIFCSPLOWO2_01_FULL_39_23]|nr:MAG: hypothetical protein A2141_03805 [Candidatus Woesebacteria bacterium RBG_16_40_11]OGM61667.1 MAG: hypothetical protein A3A76_05505 [Candidatus Woesebacteria bacterium RIFCSPLOWO2_01_FULL_39_23]